MAQELAFDKLARVFDNATANYVAESQRKKELADQRAYAEKTKADDRGYAKSVRDEERGYVKDDRVDARTYAKSVVDDERKYSKDQRGVIRGEQREDALWSQDRALAASLVQEGFLSPADVRDPAKVSAAWVNLTPSAKERVQNRKQAIDEIVKTVKEFGTLGIPGAESPELLAGDAVFSVAGALRQKAASVKQRTGAHASGIMAKLDEAGREQQDALQLIDPTVTAEDRQAAESQFGPGAADPNNAPLIAAAAEAIAQNRAKYAAGRARAIGGKISGLNQQLGTIDNLARAGIHLPEQAAPAPAARQQQPSDSVADPMAGFLGAAKAKRDAAAQAQQEQKSAHLAKNTYAADLEEQAQTAETRRAAAAFSDLVPRASMSDDGMRAKVEGMKRPGYSFALPGMGAPGSVEPRSLSTEEKSDEMDALLLDRTTSDAEVKRLAASIIPNIRSLPMSELKKLTEGLSKMGITMPDGKIPQAPSELDRMMASFGNQNFFSK